MAQRRNYVGPRDALGPRLKKIEITPVANESQLDPVALPRDSAPDDYDLPPLCDLTDVIRAAKEISKAQVGGFYVLGERVVDRRRGRKFPNVMRRTLSFAITLIKKKREKEKSIETRSRKNQSLSRCSLIFLPGFTVHHGYSTMITFIASHRRRK